MQSTIYRTTWCKYEKSFVAGHSVLFCVRFRSSVLAHRTSSWSPLNFKEKVARSHTFLSRCVFSVLWWHPRLAILARSSCLFELSTWKPDSYAFDDAFLTILREPVFHDPSVGFTASRTVKIACWCHCKSKGTENYRRPWLLIQPKYKSFCAVIVLALQQLFSMKFWYVRQKV